MFARAQESSPGRPRAEGETPSDESRSISDRYTLFGRIDSGGMASVHFGRAKGAMGFSRPVAIKRLHERLSQDPAARSMFVDEARLAARIHHPNVVQTLDVVIDGNELFLVMEYVHGESLGRIARAVESSGAAPTPVPVALALMIDVLHGLHAAHEAKLDDGRPLKIVHRDVSPQNILVGADGVTRLFDFGVAHAEGRLHTTEAGAVKGKLAYMAPEQLRGEVVTRAVDIFAAGIVLWELLTGRRLFQSPVGGGVALLDKILNTNAEPPSRYSPHVDAALDAILARALCRDPAGRFSTAEDMARALERLGRHATPTNVGHWLAGVAGERLSLRSAAVRSIERSSVRHVRAAGLAATGPVSGRAASTPLTSASTLESRLSVARTSPGVVWLRVAAGIVAASLVTAVVATTPRDGSAGKIDVNAAGARPTTVDVVRAPDGSTSDRPRDMALGR